MTNSAKAIGKIIEIRGRTLGKTCNPIPNASIDVWQANAFGKYSHRNDLTNNKIDKNFIGYTNLKTDSNGFYRFKTILPGSYKVAGRIIRTPHIHLFIETPAGNKLSTQIYFKDNLLNKKDFLLSKVKQKNLLEVDLKKNENGLLAGNFNIII